MLVTRRETLEHHVAQLSGFLGIGNSVWSEL